MEIDKVMADKELRLLLTQACNYDCVFCNHEGLNNKVSKKLNNCDYSYLYTVCRDNFDWRSVSLTGGEPLLYKDFDDLVLRIAKQQGLITVISNGALLDKHMSSVDLLKRINLSLHSLDPQKYDGLVQRKGRLPKVISNINAVRINSPHVDVRLNVVLSKGFNDSSEDIKRLLDFADFNGCSIKFIELANDKDKIVTLDELKEMLKNLGLKERFTDKRKTVMSNNIILTRTSCEDAQRTNDPSAKCQENMDFFVTPNGAVNHCVVTNEESSILGEIRSRDDEALVAKLKTISQSFGRNCSQSITNER